MKEILLTSKRKKNNGADWPNDLGPGPIDLKGGDVNAGFFGEISQAALITSLDLASALGVTQGSSMGATIPWLKFIIDGKIIYIARAPLRRGISWNHLYSKGLVYGTNTVGRFPVGTPVNQYKTLELASRNYLVRLLRGSEDDPSSQPDSTAKNTKPENEWDRLFVAARTESWFKYTDAELGIGIVGIGDSAWCQESSTTNTGLKLARGSASTIHGFHMRDGSLTDNNRGWRPVLQLLQD